MTEACAVSNRMQMRLRGVRSTRDIIQMPSSVTSPIHPDELEAFLHDKIPLTRAMQVRVAASTRDQLTLEAPLEPNRNHLGTAFGGALHTLPILACYSALWLTLREAGLDAHVVVKHSEADYKQPVTGPLRAITSRPSVDLSAKFIEDLRRHKKARMELSAIIEGSAGKNAVEFRGTFVAVL
jgi:thioesterase domain-containing protein